MQSSMYTLTLTVLFIGVCHGWGGLFNRFSPELLSNLGYGGFSSYKLQPLINVSGYNVFFLSSKWTLFTHLTVIHPSSTFNFHLSSASGKSYSIFVERKHDLVDSEAITV